MHNPVIYRPSTLKSASKILKRVKKAPDSDKIVVFLGGECHEDNPWRDDIKKEFGDRIYFIDPFDEDWEPVDNIYDELAGMIVSDYVVFYRGGKATKKEKQFLDIAGDDEYAEFNDLDKLREYLGRISVKTKTAEKVPVKKLKLADLGEKQRFFRNDHYGPSRDKTVFYSNFDDEGLPGVFLVHRAGNDLQFNRVRSPGWILVGNVFSGHYKEVSRDDIFEIPPEHYRKTASQEDDMKKHPITTRLDAVADYIEPTHPREALMLDRVSDQLEKPVVLPMGWTPGRRGPMHRNRGPWLPGQRFEGQPEPGMGCFQCPGCGCGKQVPVGQGANLCCPNCGGKMAAVNPE